jgi:ribonucleoside-diphosphate reductase alpha chain
VKRSLVLKRGGGKEVFDPEKIHDKCILATEGLHNVSASQIELNADLQIINHIKTEDIQDILIKSASDLISENNPNYQYVAARLLNQKIRKEVYNQYQPLPFKDEVLTRISKGLYDKELLRYYSKKELEYFGSKIRYEKDNDFTYAGLKQMYEKYLITRYDSIVETPQEVFMLINLYMFMKYEDKTVRRRWIMVGYKALSNFEISLPTPIMVGLRSNYRRTVSCNGIDCGDDVYTLANANRAIPILTASRSGIGLGTSFIRGLGADIDNGRVKHTGIIPILKGYEKSTKMFTQESRGGGATSHAVFFSSEIENYLILKNNKGTEENRVWHMDHVFQVNRFFYEQYLHDGDITLFFLNDVPGLIEAMADHDRFTELYNSYRKSIPKKKQTIIKAKDLMELFAVERMQTGRIYLMNMDHANNHSSYKEFIKQTNLCTEIFLPNSPLYRTEDRKIKIRHEDYNNYLLYRRIEDDKVYNYFSFVKDDEKENCIRYRYLTEKFVKSKKKSTDFYRGEIFVCILASINIGMINNFDNIEHLSEYIVRFLDELIDYQEYAMDEVAYAAIKRRALGIGVSDLFHLLAKNRLKYNSIEGRNLIHKYTEEVNYHLHRASILLAKEKGVCDLYNKTKYSEGLFPIDSAKKVTNELTNIGYLKDWEGLRVELKKYGMRHSSLMALAPTSNSSRVSNSTPSIEPPRFLVNTKEDKKMVIKQVVPDFYRYKNYYTTAWSDDFNNIDYFKLIAIVQKFVDQGISVNQYIDLTKYKDNKYPYNLFIKEILTAYQYGLKALYYTITKTSNNIEEDLNDEACEGGACAI